MASRDYMHCEGCDGKLVYDADWYHKAAHKVVVGLCERCRAKGWKIIVCAPGKRGKRREALPRDGEGCEP